MLESGTQNVAAEPNDSANPKQTTLLGSASITSIYANTHDEAIGMTTNSNTTQHAVRNFNFVILLVVSSVIGICAAIASFIFGGGLAGSFLLYILISTALPLSGAFVYFFKIN